MPRRITVGAGQMGPIARDESKDEVVDRLMALLHEAGDQGVDLLVYPELAMTTFFPRWFVEDPAEFDHHYHREMPDRHTKPLFDEARRLGIGFALGYAELHIDEDGVEHRYNTYILVERDGTVVSKFRKIHIPGHADYEPSRPFQHAERHYFEPGPHGFGAWQAFEGVVGMAICNDRRWSETYAGPRSAGGGVDPHRLQHAPVLLARPHPERPVRIPQPPGHAGRCLPERRVRGRRGQGGFEEGVESLSQSVIIAPSGQIIAQSITLEDELITATIDLDFCETYKGTLFNFDYYRMPEHYGLVTERRGAVAPPASD